MPVLLFCCLLSKEKTNTQKALKSRTLQTHTDILIPWHIFFYVSLD